jgi:glutathione S-transferase
LAIYINPPPRYTLNFKGIPYKTEWVEFPDIEPVCKKLGIPPTSKKADGSDHYTLPAIHDPSTGAYMADSILIAEYLDKTYPDTPQVFPNNTLALQATFTEALQGKLGVFFQFIVHVIGSSLNPRSQEPFRGKMEKAFGKAIEEIAPKGEAADAEWAKFQDGLTKVDSWYAKNGGKGPFLLGETASWGDLVVASYLSMWRTLWGEDSQQWKDISSWNNGRWAEIAKALKKYETVL